MLHDQYKKNKLLNFHGRLIVLPLSTENSIERFPVHFILSHFLGNLDDGLSSSIEDQEQSGLIIVGNFDGKKLIRSLTFENEDSATTTTTVQNIEGGLKGLTLSEAQAFLEEKVAEFESNHPSHVYSGIVKSVDPRPLEKYYGEGSVLLCALSRIYRLVQMMEPSLGDHSLFLQQEKAYSFPLQQGSRMFEMYLTILLCLPIEKKLQLLQKNIGVDLVMVLGSPYYYSTIPNATSTTNNNNNSLPEIFTLNKLIMSCIHFDFKLEFLLPDQKSMVRFQRYCEKLMKMKVFDDNEFLKTSLIPIMRLQKNTYYVSLIDSVKSFTLGWFSSNRFYGELSVKRTKILKMIEQLIENIRVHYKVNQNKQQQQQFIEEGDNVDNYKVMTTTLDDILNYVDHEASSESRVKATDLMKYTNWPLLPDIKALFK